MFIRSARLEDLDACLALDASYVTDRVWQMNVHEMDGAIHMNFRTVWLPRPTYVVYPRDHDTLQADWYYRDCFQVALDRRETADEKDAPAPNVIGYLTMSAQDWHHTGWIADLVVSPQQRRQGVGRALLEAAKKWAHKEGLRRLMIEVQTKNYPGIKFVERCGFEFCGFNDRYYTNQDIALFFALNLGSRLSI